PRRRCGAPCWRRARSSGRGSWWAGQTTAPRARGPGAVRATRRGRGLHLRARDESSARRGRVARRSWWSAQAGPGTAGGPGAPALRGLDLLGDLDLLFAGGLVGGRGVLPAPVGVP